MPKLIFKVASTSAGIRTALQQKLLNLIGDKQTKIGVNKILLDAITPYVPLQEENGGALRESGRVTPTQISWNTPYAHYQYEGIVYGPNIPMFTSQGVFQGWRSPRGKQKFPTGGTLEYKTPGTSDHWIDAMWRQDRASVQLQITHYLKQRAREKDL